MNLIKTSTYNQIIEVLPILCVDIVIQNIDGKYLLIKRANEPIKGCWWVVGGRVHKEETCEEAAIRKVWEEVSLNVKTLLPMEFNLLIIILELNFFIRFCFLDCNGTIFAHLINGCAY